VEFRKRKITTASAIKSLGENGITVNDDEAKVILDFLYLLAAATLQTYLKDDMSHRTSKVGKD